MKKYIIIGLMLIIIFPLNMNISYGESINLVSDYIDNYIIYNGNRLNETYYHDYDTGGEFNYGKYDFSNNTGWDLSVYYTWLHNLDKLLNKINSDEVSYQDIIDSNSEEDISYAQDLIKNLKPIVATFAYKGKYVDEPRDTSNYNDLLNTKRSRAAFENITGYSSTDSYINYMDKALREINAAYDKKRGESSYAGDDGNKININDNYETKFKYTYQQIYAYRVRSYGERYNVSNANIISKVWNAKVGLYSKINDSSISSEEKEKLQKFQNVLTRTDLYVDKNDSYSTKMSYDNDKMYLYYQVFGDDYGSLSDKEKENFKNKMAKALGKAEDSTEAGKKYINEHQNDFSNKYSQAEYEKNNAEAIENSGKKEDSDKDTVFKQPTGTTHVSNGAEDAMTDAENFLSASDKDIIEQGNLQEFSQNLYGILLAVGVVVAVIIGVILGVKLMLAPVGEKAEAKKLLIPYVVGCVVVFGAFGIWKLVVTIMQGI